MKLILGVIVPVCSIILTTSAFSQSEIHSGFLQTEASTGANVLKLHCDELTNDVTAAALIADLMRYEGILDVRCYVETNKILVKYTQPSYANLILGILERSYLSAYYLDNGTPVYYVKTGDEHFLR